MTANYDPEKPYDELPLLPPNTDLETKVILKKLITSSRALSELKGAITNLPNPTLFIDTINLQEAQASSAIENIITTQDELFMAAIAEKKYDNPATKEVMHYKNALWFGFQEIEKRPFLTTNLFIKMAQIIKENTASIRNAPGTQLKNPKPLKNQDGTFTDKGIHAGVFPQPGDNALLGRGSVDLVVKQDEVLLRAGKFKGQYLKPNEIPVANPQRGFLQLTKFQTTKQSLEPRVYFELTENVLLTKYLIEWVVTNPENEQGKFSGAVYLYQLKPDSTTNSKNLTVTTEVSENLKKLVATEEFSMLNINEVIRFINDFIKTCNTTYFRH